MAYWCNQVFSEKSENQITFSKSSNDETACGAAVKAVIENLITIVEEKEKETANTVKKERSLHMFEFRPKI